MLVVRSSVCLGSRYLTIFLGRHFTKLYRSLILAETWMDLQAKQKQTYAWLRGLCTKGFEGAHKAAAGLA